MASRSGLANPLRTHRHRSEMQSNTSKYGPVALQPISVLPAKAAAAAVVDVEDGESRNVQNWYPILKSEAKNEVGPPCER